MTLANAPGVQVRRILFVGPQNVFAEPILQEIHHLDRQSNFVFLKFALKFQDRVGKAIVLGLLISQFRILVRLQDAFFRLEVRLGILDEAGKNGPEMLLALPQIMAWCNSLIRSTSFLCCVSMMPTLTL